MDDAMIGKIEEGLADAGFRGLFVVTRAGVVTLEGALPATDEALEVLETAFSAVSSEAQESNLAEEALAS